MGQRPSLPTSANAPIAFFEGTEKRIELDFLGSGDLRNADYSEWEEVTALCKTTILHSKQTSAFTSFLLSESSLIVYPSKVIIKTCGRTVPLQCLQKVWSIAQRQNLEPEWGCYSRKNFLDPSDQPEQHRDYQVETAYCRKVFDGKGDAHVLGPLTGDHWLLYQTDFHLPDCSTRGDLTIDIMMYGLPAHVRDVFFTDEPEGSAEGAAEMTRASGLADVGAMLGAEIDDYCFAPCGYSCNAHAGNAYFTVHVTPQEECSYASFETNFGTSFNQLPAEETGSAMNKLVDRVLQAFQPARMTMTLFIDLGGLAPLGNAPFQAAEEGDYRRKNLNSYHFETDYVVTVANYIRTGSASEAEIPVSRAAILPRFRVAGA